ncbi:hypothetical protein TrRE_jg9857 [Triparma retinervis]|uniref:Uncharacterized protein n=1 Tax=Triparma retinervis TaxID=2557542 RepID=A0A9W6ZHE9_9STRA|nr:hypothetical protein TrRE_jg9857 [Triparma retinervis]
MAIKRTSHLQQSTATTSSDPTNGLIKRGTKILKEPALWEYNFGLQDPSLPLPHDITARVTPPETYDLTSSQIATLESEGVLLIKGAFDSCWVDYLRAATKAQVEAPHFWSFAGTASKLGT